MSSQTDLHMHSVYSSDGEYMPEELVEKCCSAGIEIMAIADHNSCGACGTGIYEAGRKGMTCIPAIELDCFYNGTSLHVLGYGIDYRDDRYADYEKYINRLEASTSALRLQKMRERGLYIDEEKAYSLAHNGFVAGEVVAETALSDPRNDHHPMLEAYREGGSRSDNPYVNFYWDWCAPGRPVYIPIPYPSFREVLDLIRRTGGIPVLAHPGNNVKENGRLLEDILKEGIQGIEVYSSYHSADQVNYYREKALQYHLHMTCGSDFHGKTKPSITLGTMDLAGDEQRIRESLKILGLI